jgi:hypothetical protein
MFSDAMIALILLCNTCWFFSSVLFKIKIDLIRLFNSTNIESFNLRESYFEIQMTVISC